MVGAEERLKIEAALAGFGYPAFVMDREVSYGTDWHGDPAVYVMLTVEDDLSTKRVEELAELSIGVRRVAARAAGEVSPYVRFQTVSDRNEAAIAS